MSNWENWLYYDVDRTNISTPIIYSETQYEYRFIVSGDISLINNTGTNYFPGNYPVPSYSEGGTIYFGNYKRDQYGMSEYSFHSYAIYSVGNVLIQRRLLNTSPTVNLLFNTQPILNGGIFNKYNIENFSFKIIPNDTDTSDTIEYSVLLNSNIIQPYTFCQKGIEFTYTIPSSSFVIGNNTIQVKIRDNNGAEASISFTVNNQQLVTGYRCLNDLKPPNYNKTTISLGEIIEFINSQP